MKLDIYSKEGQLKISAIPESNNAESLGIQEESTLALSFTGFSCVPLEVYDYTEFQGRRYWVIERYVPKMNARREWAYAISLFGVEGLASQTLMVNPSDDDNPVLTLSAPAREHAALIVANLNRKMGTTDWKVGEVVVSEYIDIEYTGKYASDVLSELSEAAGTEWWFDGMTLNISRCEFGELVPLSYGDGLLGGISRSTADGVKFFTRLFPVGSSRNIDADRYGHARLQLPDGARYVEQDTHLGIIEHFEQEAFAEIYPRRIGVVGTVRHEEATGDDGDPFTIWYFTDPDIPFDPNEYEIGGLVKRITFQSGELRGREFEVNYDTEKKEFEIITQWPYGDEMQLPSEPMIPVSGDEYILWNIRMPDSYYPAAEQEYKEAVDRFMADNRKDVAVYEAPTDFTVIERRALDLRPGQRVRLVSSEAFPDTGFRDTRIVSISRSVARPGSMTLKMSDVLSTGRISRIESNLATVERMTRQVTAEFPDLIRSWEETPASDTTVYSSRKCDREFLSRRRGGTVQENVTFDKDVAVGGAVVSKDFRQGDFSGSGFGLYRDANGNAVAEVDILKARKEAVFNTAIINQVTFQIGATVFSNGGCKIARVEELDDVYRCYYDTKEGRRLCGMVADDQARCQQYDPTQKRIIKYYWRLVTSVGDDYVDLSKTFVDGSGIPEVGDEIAQFGNRKDKTRQSATIIDPQDGSSVVVYSQLDSFSLSKKNYVGLGTNPQTGRAYLFCYGDFFLGDRELKDQFLTFQIPEGQTVPQLFAKMNISLGSGSSGLTNLVEWAEKQQQLDDAAKNAQAAKTTAETANKNAEEARKSAQSAATELEIIQSDEYVSAVEKRSLKLRQADMQAEYPQIVAEAEKYGLAKVEGPFQSTPEYWEQGSANSQYTGYLWEDMKFESTKDIRTQMLLYAFAKAKFSVGTGFMVQAVCFGEDMRSISRTGAAQSITITDENTAFVSLIISKTSDADIVPEELADAALTVGAESSGGGTGPDAITDAANWEQGTIEGKEGQSYADDKYGTMSYMVRSKNLIDTPVGSAVSIRGPYQFRLTYYDAGGLCTGLTDYWPLEGDVTNGHSIVARDYPYMAVVIRKLNSAGTSTVDLTPSDIASSGFTLGDGSSGGGEAPPSADDIQPVEQPSTDHVTGFEKAYNAANAALTKYTASTPENIPTGSDFGDIYGYYTARQIILDAIADAVKAHFDTLSDYEYLKEVFPNMVLDSNGVFLSRLMAVKNSAEADAAVVAGMYGGGVETLNNDGFRDPTHGTLMFFAGATDVQNAAAANTRIYGDGSQFTKKLYANGGEIGGFTISEDKLVSGNYDVGEEEMTLSKEKIRFRHKGTSGEVYIGVNNPVLPPSLGAISCLMSVENKNPASDNRIGILIEVDGNLEALLPDRVNAAVWAESGSFVGFRPRSTYVESGQTNLDYLDSVVYVNTSSGNAVLTLPTNPQPDQMYMIRKLYAANSVSVGSSSHRIYLTGSDTPAYTATWTGRRAGIIQYNRTLNAWVLMFTFEA